LGAFCVLPVCLGTAPAAAATSAAPAPSAPELSVLGAEAFVTVLNSGSTQAHISVSFEAASPASAKAELVGPTTIDPGQAERLQLKFTGLKALSEKVNGEIVIKGGASPIAQSAIVTPALQPKHEWPLFIIIASLIATLLVVVIVVVAGWIKAKTLGWLKNPAPSPKWSFESWAAHLTAVGAVLGTVLGSVSFPETPMQIDKESLIALSLLFGALVVIAPFVFEALQRPKISQAAEGEGATGYAWALLLSCGLVLGAVIGELFTLGLATWEITGGDTACVLVEIGLGLVCVLALYYVVITACRAVVTNRIAQSQEKAPPPAVDAGPGAAVAPVVPPAGQTPASWSLP
jgi:hypothetical protein